MSIVIRHYGRVIGGIPKVYNINLYKSNIEHLEGKEFELIIKEKHENASYDQHAYYRGAIIETALTSECFGGWTADEVDAYFTDKYLGITIQKQIKKNGQISIEYFRKSESKGNGFSKKKMAEFIEKCIAELAQEGIVVHSPEQYKLNKFKSSQSN